MSRTWARAQPGQSQTVLFPEFSAAHDSAATGSCSVSRRRPHREQIATSCSVMDT